MIELTITMVSESRGKRGKKKKAKSKKASGRSAMLKTMMPQLSGDNGDRLAAALEALDEKTVASVLDGIRDRVVKQILVKKEKMHVN